MQPKVVTLLNPKSLFIKLFLLFILYTLYSILNTPTAFAQSPATHSSQLQPIYNPQPYIPPNSPNSATQAIYNFAHATSCILIGQSQIAPCLEYKTFTDAQGIIRSVPVLNSVNTSYGTLGAVFSVMENLYAYPPINSYEFIAHFSQEIGIIEEANAQVGGSGSGVLSPVFALWELSRNIAYLIMILIFVLVGLMVMFRQKLNPQTVISIQLALPSLVIGLIMITFSYFFASLIVDLGFIGINLVGYYFTIAQGAPAQDLLADISSQNILSIFSKFIGVINRGDITHALQQVFNNSGPAVQDFMRFAAGLMAFQYGSQVGHVIPVVGDLAGIVTGSIAALGTAAFVTEIFGWALSWVAMVILIYSMIKLLLRLINNYLSIVFLTISAPFQFLMASLPGRQGIATNWMLNMLCNVLVFPSVIAVLYFVAFLLRLNVNPFVITGGVQIISQTTLPLLGGLSPAFINTLLAFGALVALPSVPDIVCKTIGRLGPAGQMLSGETNTNIAGGQRYSNQWQQSGQVASSSAQSYQSFRGRPPDWSPAKQVSGSSRWRWITNIPGLGPRGS